MWLFDVAWALAGFFGVQGLTQRPLSDGSSCGAAPYANFAALALLTTMALSASRRRSARDEHVGAAPMYEQLGGQQ